MYHHSSTLTRAALRGIAAAACLFAVSAHAITVKVKVENLSAYDGLWFTPVFFGFHNGSFDTFDPGVAAPNAIKYLAEEGDPSGLISNISAVAGAKSHVLLQDGSGAPPGVLFAPGESNYFTINLNSIYNRYLSFASMLLPSNDAFFGNASPTQYELFDINGKFKGYQEINLFGSSIWDAGTEENDLMGAPFSPIGGFSTDTINGYVSLLGQAGLDGFNGAALATGGFLSKDLLASDQIARISIQQVKVPDSTQFIGLMGAIALIGFRFATKRRMGNAAA